MTSPRGSLVASLTWQCRVSGKGRQVQGNVISSIVMHHIVFVHDFCVLPIVCVSSSLLAIDIRSREAIFTYQPGNPTVKQPHKFLKVGADKRTAGISLQISGYLWLPYMSTSPQLHYLRHVEVRVYLL